MNKRLISKKENPINTDFGVFFLFQERLTLLLLRDTAVLQRRGEG